MRATLFNAMLSADVQNKLAFGGLQFYRKPDEVRARIHIKQGQLQLLPIAPLTHFARTASPAAAPLGKHDISTDETEDEVDFYILPAAKHPIEGRITTFKEDALVAAFWWVGLTDVKKDVNMEMTTVTKKKVDIPCLTNLVDLNVGDKLIKYRGKATAAAEPDQPEAHAKKKAKTIKKKA